MPNQDTKTATSQKDQTVKHIKKIEPQPTKISADGQNNGQLKGEVRSSPSLGAGCIPVGV